MPRAQKPARSTPSDTLPLSPREWKVLDDAVFAYEEIAEEDVANGDKPQSYLDAYLSLASKLRGR